MYNSGRPRNGQDWQLRRSCPDLCTAAWRQPLRRTEMGVRVEVRYGESIEQAVRRFQDLVRRLGPPGAVKRNRWHKKPWLYFLKPSVLQRRKKLLAKNETYRGECA